MVRSIFGGGTDYSHQSFEGMEQDLIVWIQYTTEDIKTIKDHIDTLQLSGYWDRVDFDFKGIVSYALKFYDTALKELIAITKEMQHEVRIDHYKRIKSIGENAIRLNHDFGQIWHKDYENKEYGNDQFMIVENIYVVGRNRAISLQDLQNLSDRIKDFIGKKNIPPPNTNDISEKAKNLIFGSIWIIDSENIEGSNITQGTAFMAKGHGLITCAHVISDKTIAYKAEDISKKYPVEVVKQNDAIDIAVLKFKDPIESCKLEVGDSDKMEILDPIILAGFPNYNMGDSGVIKSGKICGFRNKSVIRRFLIDASIICGNSGGPVFDKNLKVIGIAVTGADRMEVSDETEDHGVIPINALFLLSH